MSQSTTSGPPFLTSVHGREHREEHGVEMRALQAAVKHGVKERANPGRAGDPRWRFTYEGVVYITDESCKHEITSWKLHDGTINLAAADGVGGAHVVLVVDHSGSMRKTDVANYSTRTAAVYDCLARDFVQAQLAAGAGGADVVVSLVEMSDSAEVTIEKAPLDEQLAQTLKSELFRERSLEHAASPSNALTIIVVAQAGPTATHDRTATVRLAPLGFAHASARTHMLLFAPTPPPLTAPSADLPALDKALEILQQDAPNRGTLMLLFLSDGAPSDHVERHCDHGVAVWKEAPVRARMQRGRIGRAALNECPYSMPRWQCRQNTRNAVCTDCVKRVLQIGDLLGRDRVVVGTVAFGDPNQDYNVLQQMGEALPRGSFQKLGLNAGGLRTAFSSLSSSLTTLRTDGTSKSLTLREKEVCKDQGKDDEAGFVSAAKSWFIYNGDDVQKMQFVLTKRDLMPVTFTDALTGLAFYKDAFAQGVERFVYRCAEVSIPKDKGAEWYDWRKRPLQMRAHRGDLRLVAKEAKHTENLGRKFQSEMARIQAEAAEIARAFNRQVGGRAERQLNFLDVHVYKCNDEFCPYNEDLDRLVESCRLLCCVLTSSARILPCRNRPELGSVGPCRGRA
jgi:hypothetical protein